jgi:hypothetical protein
MLVGCGSGAIGAEVLVAPEEASRVLGLSNDLAMGAIGAADLALAPGPIRGRPRWRWVAARAALNLAIAGFLLRSRSAASSPNRPFAAAIALAAVTVADMRIGTVLYAARN